MTKRIICAILSLVLIFVLAGCRETENTESKGEGTVITDDKPEEKNMQLIYCLSDTFNPYTAATPINRELCGLLYDSLIKLDNKFEPHYALAKDIQIEENKYTVTLKTALFSDGSAVTANDVVYSFNLAKASKTAFAGHLYEFSSAVAGNGNTVILTADKKDPFGVNLLDFPILKAESEKVTDEDGVLHPPIGSGRYILNEEKDALIINSNYYGVKGSVQNIRLINAPDAESVSHYVEIGATDIYFTDVLEGKIVRMSGKKTDINLTDFVYIGINHNDEMLNIPEIRYAVSTAIDRENICQTAYFNNAISADGFFHPDFNPAKSLQNIKKSSDLKIAIENLEKIGYNRLDNNGYRINSKGKRLTFSLLVNSDNSSRLKAAQLISNQLKQAGIEMKTVEKPYAEYIAALAAGGFQFYIGALRLTPNMDFSSLLLPGGSAAYGVKKVESSKTDEEKKTDKLKDSKVDSENSSLKEKEDSVKYENVNSEDGQALTQSITASDMIIGFYNGEHSITDVASSLLTELPAIPICYRMGLLFYDSDVVNLKEASQNDIYYSDETGHFPVE